MEDGTDASGQESGSSLRDRLEATIETNRGLTGRLAEITASSHKFVTADDLKDVGYDQMEAKAAEISAQRAAERETVLRDALVEKGYQGDDLEAALAQLGGTAGSTPAPATEPKPAATPFASTGSLAGGPPGSLPNENVRGVDRILAALTDKKS